MTNIDTDTNRLIKNIATDIICITTLGIGLSLFVIKIYL